MRRTASRTVLAAGSQWPPAVVVSPVGHCGADVDGEILYREIQEPPEWYVVLGADWAAEGGVKVCGPRESPHTPHDFCAAAMGKRNHSVLSL